MEPIFYTLDQLGLLPPKPGVYLFYNAAGKLIYVGKAKNLKKRVGSYFKQQAQEKSIKVRKMTDQVVRTGLVLVDTEYEALLLENNFIKQNQPKYNILLKDGKSYPYLCITNERFPRIIRIRQQKPPTGVYFGPFTHKASISHIQELLRELFPLRSCTYNLSKDNIQKKKYKVCLEYHIGNCLGPCEGLQDEASYEEDIAAAKALLKGNFKGIKAMLKKKMLRAASELAFDKAQAYKQKIEAVESYRAKSLITRIEEGAIDVIAIIMNEERAFVNYLHMHNGMIVFGQTVEIQKKLKESPEDLIATALCHFRERAQSKAKKVYANLVPSVIDHRLTLIIPKIGEKKSLVELAIKNALFFKQEQLNKKVQAPKGGSKSLLIQLQQDLRLQQVPMHIECFDNSNLQGTHPVAAMVCFKKGAPAKNAYRHFHVKSVVGANDVASMQEIVRRRYTKLLEGKATLPDLIIIDGGKPQLNAVVKTLKQIGLYGKVAVVAIAKKLEAIYYPYDPHPLYINKKSPSLQLLQRIRNEAHRFAITFHRHIRSTTTLESQLESIVGIGPRSVARLLACFKNVAVIKKASLKELEAQVGIHKAKAIYTFFRLKNT